MERAPVGVRSDFFDLGGDSLALLSIFAAIEVQFGRCLTVDALSGGLTIAGLAQILARDEAPVAKTDPVVALQPLGHLPPFFCVHGIGGNVLHLQLLATRMGTDRPFLGLHQTADARLPDSLSELAARYITAMLAHQPAGPYYLGGVSFGATVAYEMAHQLVEKGHEVGLLAIIDQRRPGWRLTPRNAIPALPQILAKLPRRIRGELSRVPVVDRVPLLSRLLLKWSKLALGQRLDAALMFDLSEPDQILLYEANLRALRSYRPKPVSASITLFRASDQMLSHLPLDSTLGWKDLAENGVHIRIVPGNHGTITGEPFVRELAKKLSNDLDAAQGVPSRIEFVAE